MPVSQPELLDQLTAFSIGSAAAALPFNARLARENAWSPSYAAQAVDEYKRFLYLMLVSNEPLTPSDAIDQVWHLHLCYSHSYWIEFCRDLAHRDLHHWPTEGGAKARQRFIGQYQRTLTLYQQEFDQPPPLTLWPDAAERFNRHADFVRIDRGQRWLIKKPRASAKPLAVAAGIVLLLSACSENLADQGLGFWLKTALGLFVLYKIFSWLDSGGGGGGSGCGGCSGCSGCGGGD
jgi:hypothetical protein